MEEVYWLDLGVELQEHHRWCDIIPGKCWTMHNWTGNVSTLKGMEEYFSSRSFASLPNWTKHFIEKVSLEWEANSLPNLPWKVTSWSLGGQLNVMRCVTVLQKIMIHLAFNQLIILFSLKCLDAFSVTRLSYFWWQIFFQK